MRARFDDDDDDDELVGCGGPTVAAVVTAARSLLELELLACELGVVAVDAGWFIVDTWGSSL